MLDFLKRLLGDSSRPPLVESRDEAAPGDLDASFESTINISPEARLLSLILSQAYEDKAREIRLRRKGEVVPIVYLIDGESHDIMSPPAAVWEGLHENLARMCGVSLSSLRSPGTLGVGMVKLHGRERRIEVRVTAVETIIKMA